MECCRRDDVIASLAATFSHRATFDEQMLLLLLSLVVVIVAVVVVVVAVVVVDFDTVLHFSLACETVSSCTGGARPRWAPPTLTATYFLIIKYTLSAPVLQHTKVQT